MGLIDLFEEQVDALLEDVRGGALTNVSSETMKLAEQAVGRQAETSRSEKPEWVDKVSKAVAQLDD
jgi:hypothetical protein